MTNNNIDFILNEIFFNDIEEALTKLKDYELYDVIEKKIDVLNSKTKNDSSNVISTIVGSFYQSVNSKLSNISDQEDKIYLEYLISSIGNHLIKTKFKEGIINDSHLKGIKDQLQIICELEGYNYNELKKLVPIDTIVDFVSIQKTKQTDKPSYYEWNGDDNLFHEIIKNLSSENSITSIKDFKKLFSEEPVSVKINPNSKDFLVILIDTLYELRIIKTKVKKGHFIPLKNFAVDFENNILFKKEMKHIKFTIKKNTVKYLKLRTKVENWIDTKVIKN